MMILIVTASKYCLACAWLSDPMEPGWNKRIWNTVEYSAGDSIYDAGNGGMSGNSLSPLEKAAIVVP